MHLSAGSGRSIEEDISYPAQAAALGVTKQRRIPRRHVNHYLHHSHRFSSLILPVSGPLFLSSFLFRLQNHSPRPFSLDTFFLHFFPTSLCSFSRPALHPGFIIHPSTLL